MVGLYCLWGELGAFGPQSHKAGAKRCRAGAEHHAHQRVLFGGRGGGEGHPGHTAGLGGWESARLRCYALASTC